MGRRYGGRRKHEGKSNGNAEEGAMDGVFVAAAVAVSKWDGGVEQRRTKQVRYDLLQVKTTTQQTGQLQRISRREKDQTHAHVQGLAGRDILPSPVAALVWCPRRPPQDLGLTAV